MKPKYLAKSPDISCRVQMLGPVPTIWLHELTKFQNMGCQESLCNLRRTTASGECWVLVRHVWLKDHRSNFRRRHSWNHSKLAYFLTVGGTAGQSWTHSRLHPERWPNMTSGKRIHGNDSQFLRGSTDFQGTVATAFAPLTLPFLCAFLKEVVIRN